MNLDEIIGYCLKKPGTWSDFPFDEYTMVIKVSSKMFCLIGNDEIPRINLKCDPIRAEALRQKHSWILPGYHMNKLHWNTLILKDSADPELVKELIDHSYELVFKNLNRKERSVIKN
ncbi:MmcQ/YjbR family DNA-binding protein [Candidatus Cloacimonadota bacterium]